MEVTCLVKREGNQYASLCVELDVASCGRTKTDALNSKSFKPFMPFMVKPKSENNP